MSISYQNMKKMVVKLQQKHKKLHQTLQQNNKILQKLNNQKDDPFDVHLPEETPQKNNLKQEVQDLIIALTKDFVLKVKIVTYNVMGAYPNTEIKKIFNEEDHSEIYVISLQEIVEMKARRIASSFISGCEEVMKNWKICFLKALPGGPSLYHTLTQRNLLGLAIFVFVKKDFVKNVSDVQVVSIPLGVMRTLGNKGSIGVRMGIMDTSICIVCSHLAAGKQNYENRNQDFHFTARKMTFQLHDWDDESSDHFMQSDTVIWCGDLNYRLTFDYNQMDLVYKRINSKNSNDLLEFDQLLIERGLGKVFKGFKEGNINFNPTYKLVPGFKELYDQTGEEKQRMPAWCDRILFRSEKLKLLKYTSEPGVKLSDHKPVKALFDLNLRYFVAEKVKFYVRNTKQKIRILQEELRPKIEIQPTNIDLPTIFYEVTSNNKIIISNKGKSLIVVEIKVEYTTETAKKWIHISPKLFKVGLKSEEHVNLKFLVNNETVKTFSETILYDGNPILKAVIHFRALTKNSDFAETISVNVSATYMRCFFGLSLRFLCSLSDALRYSTSLNQGITRGTCPQLVQIQRFLLNCNNFNEEDFDSKNLDSKKIFESTECLNKGEAFPPTTEKRLVLYLLRKFLNRLPEPILNAKLFSKLELDDQTKGAVEAALKGMDELSKVNFLQLRILLRNLKKVGKFKTNLLVQKFYYDIFHIDMKNRYFKKSVRALRYFIECD